MAKKSTAASPSRLPVTVMRRPNPPVDLPPDAAARWGEICSGLPADYFTVADLALLKALVLAEHQKCQADALVADEGLILNGRPHPAVKLSIQLAATMASLSGKLRLCASSRIRPDSAHLKRALSNSSRPWESSPGADEFFDV